MQCAMHARTQIGIVRHLLSFSFFTGSLSISFVLFKRRTYFLFLFFSPHKIPFAVSLFRMLLLRVCVWESFFSSFLILRPFRSSFTCLFSIQANRKKCSVKNWVKYEYERKTSKNKIVLRKFIVDSAVLLLSLLTWLYVHKTATTTITGQVKKRNETTKKNYSLYIIYIFAKVYYQPYIVWLFWASSCFVAHFI